MSKLPHVEWTREHLLMALNVYPQLRFGRFHSRQPDIVRISEKMGRTPGSLAIKLCNFAALDPEQPRKGMRNVSKKDRAIWAEYEARGSALLLDGGMLLHDLFGLGDFEELDFIQGERLQVSPSEPTGETSEDPKDAARRRRGRCFFRQAILNIYDVQCCITGIAVPRLLVANHIRPAWKFPHEQFNLNNGLCLSGLHSPAFVGGLITLDERFRLVLSPRLKKQFSRSALKENFEPYENQPIRLPRIMAKPSSEGLSYHREHIFKD